MATFIDKMTVEELMRYGTLDQKISTINEMIRSLYRYNKAPIRDEENPDCRTVCIYYNEEEDEVYSHFENVEE